MKTCKHCKKEYQNKNKLYCSSKCMGLDYRGKCKFDRETPSKKEYIQIRVKENLLDSRRVYLHRHRFEQEVRPLKEGEIVHHRNENKRDNSLSNLQAVYLDEHCLHHLHNKPIDEIQFNKFGF